MSSSAFTPPPADLTRPTLTGSFGMAAGTHWLAAASAQSVLERGGNAFDAAVAGAFVLHAVEPHLNGPGGDLMGIVAPAGADPVVVDGQGPAPAGATIAHLRAEGLDDVPGSGALAAAVPAAVEALLRLLEDHGTWELGDVLAPAVHYLEDGHPAGAQLCRTIATMRDHFTDHWPDSAALWLVDGRVPEPGDVVRNPAYAATLRALVAAGTAATADLDAGTDEEARVARIRAARAEWRSGRVGQALVTGAGRPHRHSSGTDHAGVLALADLAADHVRLAEPLTLDFRGTTVHKAGFSSQGPVLLQCLAILDQLPDERLDPSTALGAHTVLEVLKLALADRDAYYGSGADPAVLAHLLTPAYAAERAALVGETASLEHRPGVVPGATPFAPPLRTPADVVVTGPRGPGQPGPAPVGVGEPTVARHGTTRGDTCHLDVVDAAGNLVALTPSGGWLQSSPTIPELGFCLGTRLQMTWLDESSPSALRPGARPRTTLSPTVLSRDGRPFAALGTPGGDQQDQWQLLYLLRLLVGGWSPQAAIDAPAFHTTAAVSSFWPRTWEPGGVVAEARLGEVVLGELRERGHVLTVAGDWTLGRISTVGRDPATGWLFGAANPRGAQGYAAGR